MGPFYAFSPLSGPLKRFLVRLLVDPEALIGLWVLLLALALLDIYVLGDTLLGVFRKLLQFAIGPVS